MLTKSTGGGGRKETRINGVATIQLSNGMWVMLDAKDLVWAKGFKWHAHKAGNTWYARTTFPRKLYMHQIIAGAGADHVNGVGLDNRRGNLRSATRRENAANGAGYANSSSAYRGVSWTQSKCKWKAQIKTANGEGKHLGYFKNEIDAALAYDEAARKEFGEFARPNIEEASSATS